MKTFKTFYASFAFICLGLVPISAMGQSMPHTFTANSAARASEMNANFTYLLERFSGIRETTVNCGNSGTGSGINTAIQNGYNSIVINGICKENIKLDGSEENIPRLLKLRGANNDASQDKIIDNSSYTEHVLTFSHAGGLLVTIDNLTISGGDRGITTWMNVNLLIRNSKVEGYKNRGITLQGNSVMQGENLTIDGSYSGATTEEQGLRMWGGAVAYIAENLTITNNQKYGLTMWLSDIWVNGNVTLTANGRAINVGRGATAYIDNATITGSAEEGIKISNGGMLEISNSTISGSSKQGIQANMGATLDMNYVSITNNQNDGVALWGAKAYIGNSTITGNTNAGIRLNNGFLSINNSTISGSTNGGIESHQQSAINLSGGVIIENNGHGIDLTNSTLFQYDDEATSYIRNNTNNEIGATMSSIGLDKVTVGGTSGSTEINLSKGSILRINTGTSITGTIWCDGSLNTGKFIKDTISLSPTTSGDC
jgi:hypothetical protein